MGFNDVVSVLRALRERPWPTFGLIAILMAAVVIVGFLTGTGQKIATSIFSSQPEAEPRTLEPEATGPGDHESGNKVEPRLNASSPITLSRTILETYNLVHIPAGPFSMQARNGQYRPDSLDGFYIGQFEVSHQEFNEFLRAQDKAGPMIQPNLPAINVSWNDALQYCKWLEHETGIRGFDLPTQREWEKAARGKLREERYPWGRTSPTADKRRCNVMFSLDEPGAPVSVDSFLPNGYGLFNVLGNVWEWCRDSYPDESTHRVIRGGSFKTSVGQIGCGQSGGKEIGEYGDVGFRIVWRRNLKVHE